MEVESHESELPTQSYDQISEEVSCKSMRWAKNRVFGKGGSVAHAQGVSNTPMGVLNAVNVWRLYKIRFWLGHFIFFLLSTFLGDKGVGRGDF